MNHIQTIEFELRAITGKERTTVSILRGETWRVYYPGYESFTRLNRSIRYNVVAIPTAYPLRLRISVVPNSKEKPYEPPF